jgi:multiple sugar transport system substrate-binding protein
MFKKLLVVLFIFSFLLSACAPAATPAAPVDEPVAPAVVENPPAGDATTLRVMLVDYIPEKTDVWLNEEIIPAFQAEHPGVEVELILVNWGTLDETIQGYFAAGEGADLINLGSEYIAQYGDSLAPLNAYLGKDAWADIEQFVPASLDTVTWDGELRGLPWLTAPRAYMCRMDTLKELGIDAIPTTYAEAIDAAAKGSIVEAGALNRAGIVTTGRLDDWQEYISLIWGLGGEIYKDNGEPTFDSAEAKAALQFMYDRRRAVYTDETIADLPEASGSRLLDGTAVCSWSNLWGAPVTSDPVWENIEFTASVLDTENFPASKPVVQVFNDWLAVPAYSKNVELAADFLKLLGSAENLNRYNSDFGSFPPRQDGWFGYVESDAVMLKLADLMNEYGKGFADVRETAKFSEILKKEMPAYFTDIQDLDTTLANIQAQYIQVLQDAGRLP